jgi:type IV secretory pathway TrbF-like protein
MLFRRTSVRYGRTPEPETPYQKAAQVWDERIGSARVQARNWRLIAFGNLFLTVGLAGGLIWQAARGTVTPWVVEVDKLGQAQAISAAVADYRPTDPQIAWHLAHFVENVRAIPADPVIVRPTTSSPTKAQSRSTIMPAPTIPSPRSAGFRSRSISRA